MAQKIAARMACLAAALTAFFLCDVSGNFAALVGLH